MSEAAQKAEALESSLDSLKEISRADSTLISKSNTAIDSITTDYQNQLALMRLSEATSRHNLEDVRREKDSLKTVLLSGVDSIVVASLNSAHEKEVSELESIVRTKDQIIHQANNTIIALQERSDLLFQSWVNERNYRVNETIRAELWKEAARPKIFGTLTNELTKAGLYTGLAYLLFQVIN